MELFSFITMFFVSKKISMLTAFVCWPPGETSALWLKATEAGVRLKVYTNFHNVPELPADDVHPEGVVLDLDCPGADTVLQKASSSRAFVPRYSWLLLDNSALNSSAVVGRLADVDILPDADVIWSSLDVSADVYKVKSGQPVTVTSCDLKRSAGLKDMEVMWSQWLSSVARRKDLKNVYLNSATVITQPQYFKGWTDLSNREIDTFPKLTYPLMMLLAEDLHFRYNMKQSALYGVASNGSFDGLAGMLQRREVDVGLTSMFLRADRMRVVHFCAETLELKGAFIFRQPAQSAVSNVFVLPFSRGVWAALGSVLLAAALQLAAAARGLAPAHPELRQLTLPECFSFAIGTICQQGFHATPGAVSARAVMLSALVCSLFLCTAYSAKVVAILQSPSAAVQTLDQLARSPLALAVQDTTYKRVYFAESSEPATQRLYRRKLLPQGERAYLSVADGVARMRTGLFAFQVEQSAGYDIISKTFTEREKCGLKEIQAFKLPMVAVPLRKHAGVRELFAVRLRWQREAGLMARWRLVWLAARPRCGAGAGGARSVGLADVLPAVQALAAGAALAVLLLAAEVAAARCTSRRRGYNSSVTTWCPHNNYYSFRRFST